jgi:hypothetical protein
MEYQHSSCLTRERLRLLNEQGLSDVSLTHLQGSSGQWNPEGMNHGQDHGYKKNKSKPSNSRLRLFYLPSLTVADHHDSKD